MNLRRRLDAEEQSFHWGEQSLVAITVVTMFLLPLAFTEPFPLTSTPFFARPLGESRTYTLWDSAGRQLDRDVYGLRTNPNWYLESISGVIFPPSLVVPPDRPADMERVSKYVRQVGRREHAEFPLRLRCEVTGPVDGQTIGTLSVQDWTITDWEDAPRVGDSEG